jgi:hypothetical protein
MVSAIDGTAEQKSEIHASEEVLPATPSVETPTSNQVLVYDNSEEVPELHMRTWVAMASMMLLKFAELLALQGPPAVVSTSCLYFSDLLTTRSSHTLDQALMLPKPRPGYPILFLSSRL